MKQLLIFSFIIFLFACNDDSGNKKLATSDIDTISVTKTFISKTEEAILVGKDIYTKEQLEFLKKVGMSNSLTVKSNHKILEEVLKKKYETKFSLKFASDSDVSEVLNKEGLLLGSLSDYTGIIPSKNIDEFKTNYEKAQEINPDFKESYFIRVSRLAKKDPGKFLQKIDIDELYPEIISSIRSGFGFIPHDQIINGDQHHPLKRYNFYLKKYNLSSIIIEDKSDCIIVDHSLGGDIRIFADKSFFNLTGKIIMNNEIKEIKKDPAILLKVDGGWLILTTWR